jgi:hydrogenase nickel incorporation protein HypB
MCSECGCGSKTMTIPVIENLLSENDRIAGHIREHLDAHNVLAINLMSSPGSGKTQLLEATIAALPKDLRIAVIEGDLETENDADRIRRHGVTAVQITTGVTCHLDAVMIHDALHVIDLDQIDVLFVENVGNLVCPADFDIGQHHDVVLLSVTEGDDKPDKYPVIFRKADLVLLTKTDLLAAIEEFSPERARAAIGRVRGPGPILEVSAKKGAGLDAWVGWIVERLAERRKSAG